MSHTQEFSDAFKQYNEDVTHDDNRPVFRTEAYSWTPYLGRIHQPSNNLTVRSDYNYGDYSAYKPSDATPEHIEDIICACMETYRKEPIVHQVLDLMSDFGSQGIRIVCTDKAQEQFGKEYAEFVGLQEFADKFLRTLYLAGTVLVKEIDGKVPLKTQKRWRSEAGLNRFSTYSPFTAQPNSVLPGKDPEGMKIVIKEEDYTKRAVMPLKWIIHDPRSICVVGGMLANFIGKPIFGLRINNQLRQEISQIPRLAETAPEYQEYLSLIPQYVFDAINTNAQFFPIDQDKIHAYYYKKDDWELWGKPIIEPILRDIKMYNKLKLADMSALDGAISSVRLWNLGSLEHEVVPSKGALDKLRNIISQNVAGGTMDFVWGPDLTFKESNTNLHQFLGPEKYESTLSSIYAGLGVPPGLTSGSGAASQTNGYVGLKTLIERLKYGRNVLVRFLNEQLKKVQESMGFKRKFKIVFDYLFISDEAAEKALLIQLADRDLISDETLRYAFDIDHSDVEDAKIIRQTRKRGKSLPVKSGPFHVDKPHDLAKLFVQKGGVSPSEVGLDLQPAKEGQETPNQEVHRTSIEKLKLGLDAKVASQKPSGSQMSGRPINSKDSTQRKKRRFVPKGASANSYSSLFIYAESAREKIDDVLTKSYLAIAGKKTVRSLTVEETESLERIKFAALSNLEPYVDIDNSLIAELTAISDVDEEIYHEKQKLVYNFVEKYGRAPNVGEKRKIECESYANIYFQEN